MKFWSISILMLASLVSFGQTYFFYDDLSEVESSPGVAIIYPKAIGPEIPDDLEAKESNESPTFVTSMPPMSSDNSETTTSVATTIDATITDSNAASTTKSTLESASTGSATLSSSTTTTSTPEKPRVMAASASAPASVYVPRPVAPKPTTHTSPATSRVWHHFNSQPSASAASNHRSAWQRVDRDSEAVESNPAPVYAAAKANTSVRPASVYVRKPVFSNPTSPPPKPVNNKNSNAEDDLAVGEYSMNHRDIYYPEINRIQAPNPMTTSTASSVSSTTTTSSSSASTSNNSSSWSSNNEYQASSSNINAAYGTKSISPYLGNTWQPSLPSPVKAIRKVVKSSKTYNDIERNQGLLSSQQPYRVRVVVQPTTKAPIIEQNYYQQKEYLQEQLKEYLADHHQNYNINRVSSSSASAAASASASASASSSDSFNKISQVQTEYSTNALDDHQRKEYVEVTQTKISPPVKSVPPAPIKSLPAPIKSLPAPIKSLPAPKPLPRPAPIKQVYATKSPPRAALRAPVFEQEYEPPRPQPIIQQQQHLEHENPEPEPYSFNFNHNDDSGNGQFRREEGDRNGVVRGSYGYTDAWGLYRIVDYVADKDGFRATIRTNEPGLVERNPVTNEVDNPADIQVAAEDTPTKVLELMRLKEPRQHLI